MRQDRGLKRNMQADSCWRCLCGTFQGCVSSGCSFTHSLSMHGAPALCQALYWMLAVPQKATHVRA